MRSLLYIKSLRIGNFRPIYPKSDINDDIKSDISDDISLICANPDQSMRPRIHYNEIYSIARFLKFNEILTERLIICLLLLYTHTVDVRESIYR